MLGSCIRRSFLDIRISYSTFPPTFLLPSQARYFNSTAQIVESPPDILQVPQVAPPVSNAVAASPSSLASTTSSSTAALKTLESKPKPVSDSIMDLLPLLRAQTSHYITAHIHARPYLVTQGDLVRLPFHMPDVVPGDVLRLNRATAIGSRDFTLKGAPYVDERIFVCRATVLGTEGEPVRVKEKTTRRNRRVKTVRSKHKFTILRISELAIKGLEEIES